MSTTTATSEAPAGGIDGQVRVIRWYTRARKFPQLLGKTPSGSRIPGGPYTVTQVVVFMVTVLLGNATMGWWGRWGLLGNWAALLAGAYGVLRLVGLLPFDSRSPVSVAGGIISAMRSPRHGELAGRPVITSRPKRVRGGCVIAIAPPTTPDPRTGVPGVAAARGTSGQRPVRPAIGPHSLDSLPVLVPTELTGVQRVLASLPTPTTTGADQNA